MDSAIFQGAHRVTASKAATFLRKFVRQAALPAILLLTCLGRLSAQGVTATVTGTVADSTGTVVPGAVVRIENTGTHESRTTTSTRDGLYSFQELQPGNYTLTVNMSGFAGFTEKQIQLAAGDSPRVDAALRVGKAGWSWDWITGWSNMNDEIRWTVNVHERGNYRVGVRHLCAQDEIGSHIRVEAAGVLHEAVIKDATSTTPIPHLDLMPRNEVPMMPWGLIELGILSLPKGETTIKLRTTKIARTSVADIKDLVVRLDIADTGEIHAA
jgi:hypothetical protein